MSEAMSAQEWGETIEIKWHDGGYFTLPTIAWQEARVQHDGQVYVLKAIAYADGTNYASVYCMSLKYLAGDVNGEGDVDDAMAAACGLLREHVTESPL